MFSSITPSIPRKANSSDDELAEKAGNAGNALRENVAHTSQQYVDRGTMQTSRLLHNHTTDLEKTQAAQKDIHRQTIHLNKQKNTLVPIHKLPVELLIDILTTSLGKDHKLNSRLEAVHVERVFDLSRVSVVWWKILKNSPELWTRVQMGRTTPPTLQYSKTLPLDIHSLCSSKHSSKHSSEQADFVNLIKPHLKRWRSPQWVGKVREPGLGVLLGSQDSSCPSLQVLDMEIPLNCPHEDLTYFSASQLQELRLSNACIAWPAEGFPILRTFHLSEINLRELPSAGSLLAFLVACPSIHEISLASLGSDASSPMDQGHAPPLSFVPSSLPSLRVLSLRMVTENFLSEILSAVHAPNLTCFTLDSGFDDEFLVETVIPAFTGREGDSLPLVACRNSGGGCLTMKVEPWRFEAQHETPPTKTGIAITISHCETDYRIEELLHALQMDSIRIPIKLHLSKHEYEYPIPPRILNQLPTTTSIIIEHDDSTLAVLEYLANPVWMDGRRHWACPNLTRIKLSSSFDEYAGMGGGAIMGAVYTLNECRPSITIHDRHDKAHYYTPGSGWSSR